MEEWVVVAEKCWCIVKHLLCAEEHAEEGIERLARIYEETKDPKVLEKLSRLALYLDALRSLRQEIVKIGFETEGLRLAGEKENKRSLH